MNLNVLNKLLLGTLVLWPMAAFVSIFMFDAPGSESNPITVGLAWSIWLYPIPVLFGTLLFFKYKKQNLHKQMLYNMYLSLSGPLMVACFILALMIFCQGQFACN